MLCHKTLLYNVLANANFLCSGTGNSVFCLVFANMGEGFAFLFVFGIGKNDFGLCIHL
jgi:hypothetical protein